MIKILSKAFDAVIQSEFLIAETDYGYGLSSLLPLINRLDIQRKIQGESFYRRLEKDIIAGCIMPPITLAFIEPKKKKPRTLAQLEQYVKTHISQGFILDGIQRLNTLKRVGNNPLFDKSRPLFINIILCPSRDNLLYRMVTLNNGQKPMSARHQIEVLASEIYDFEALGIELITEKDDAPGAKSKPSFKKADIIAAYIAFLSNNLALENTKIIQEKLDELIARQIMETDTTNSSIQFSQVISEIVRLSKTKYLYEWLKNLNNLIGFCVGIKSSLKVIAATPANTFLSAVERFEEAFANLDVSKIKLGRERRNLSRHFIENFESMSDLDSDEILLTFSEG